MTVKQMKNKRVKYKANQEKIHLYIYIYTTELKLSWITDANRHNTYYERTIHALPS